MKNLETITSNQFGQYETRKNLNLSGKTIPAHIIESLENGEFTFEMIESLKKDFPILRYKTCITVHGIFNLESLPRICGYKNVIQNKNKSVEIRYNAIDFDKKNLIAKNLYIAQSGFRFQVDSNGAYFQKANRIESKSDFLKTQLLYDELQERLKKIDFYGKVNVWRGADFLGNVFLVLDVFADCIPQKSVNALMLAMADKTQSEFDAMHADHTEKMRLENIEAERIKTERETAQKLIDAKKDELRQQIASFPAFQFIADTIGVKVIIANYSVPSFQFIRVIKKGAFNRVKYQFQVVASLADFDELKFKDALKERKISELKDYKLFSLKKDTTLPVEGKDAPKQAQSVKTDTSGTKSDLKLEIIENPEFNGIELKFADKPPITVLSALKANFWRWHHAKKVWYNKATETNRAFALGLQ